MTPATTPATAPAFFGATFAYPTPDCGLRRVGVFKTMSDLWSVGWLSDNGCWRRVKTNHLPFTKLPHTLQNLLDSYAFQRGFAPCTEDPTCHTCSSGPAPCRAVSVPSCPRWQQRPIIRKESAA